METDNTTSTRGPQSVINRSAVKAFALKVSKERRAGKFTRVGEDFLDQIEAEVEAVIRGISGLAQWDQFVKPDESLRGLTTGAALDKVREKLEEKTILITHGKVMRHPSIGCTLKT